MLEELGNLRIPWLRYTLPYDNDHLYQCEVQHVLPSQAHVLLMSFAISVQVSPMPFLVGEAVHYSIEATGRSGETSLI